MAAVPIPSTINSLPSGIVEDILLRLSLKEMIRCRTNFAHLGHFAISLLRVLSLVYLYSRDKFSSARKIVQPLAHPERVTEFVGCCNGLLLLHNRYHDLDLAIWNPTIQKFKRIPFAPIELPAGTQRTHTMYGFGYDQSSSDYKIVRIVESESNLWKKIQSFPYTGNSSHFYAPAVPLNGAIHWLVTDNSHSQSVRVIALDLSKETFNEFSTPFADVEGGIGLEVLGGSLCICLNHFKTSNEVWKMKEYGVAESWVHFYTVEWKVVKKAFEYCTTLVLSKIGERVLLHNDSNLTKGFLFWYNFETNIGKVVRIPGSPAILGQLSVQPTLVSLLIR
ncbi:putative galactose oxidase/kelch, beta-propeller, F-box associated interaction [Rosa chinensis]|uniref:Putative galactose oxidase/kelch, beta-propeller, F-box associated interaction n=1 Tax=Rosa chinensis TaxID=74649 RepID=A0A2P6PX06_ROSCH|nr:putative galactose oxidase/kelch, beta-propeller, F-box associated interaction [Rosa chinensis]